MAVAPTLYSLHIFNKFGECIFYTEWHRESTPEMGERQVVVGLVYAMQRKVVEHLSKRGSEANFTAIHTSHYKLHFMHARTGYRFVLLTAPFFPTKDGQDLLDEIFATVFVQFVSKDANFRHEEGVTITSPTFQSALRELMLRKQLLR